MSNPGTLCNDEWIALLVLIVAVLGNWLYPGAQISERVRAYYDRYRKQEKSWWPASWVYGIVWGLLYALLVPAIFLVYYYDDACIDAAANWDYRLELPLWILILVNLLLNKAWDAAISNRNKYYADFSAALLTALVSLTAIAITVLLFVLAADNSVHDVIYFSAAVYALYSLWTIIATVVAFDKFWTTSAQYRKKMSERVKRKE